MLESGKPPMHNHSPDESDNKSGEAMSHGFLSTFPVPYIHAHGSAIVHDAAARSSRNAAGLDCKCRVHRAGSDALSFYRTRLPTSSSSSRGLPLPHHTFRFSGRNGFSMRTVLPPSTRKSSSLP
ncbi:hypothetical protein PMIN07_002104 [Paraphaeosphaeria minitans]